MTDIGRVSLYDNQLVIWFDFYQVYLIYVTVSWQLIVLQFGGIRHVLRSWQLYLNLIGWLAFGETMLIR